MENLLLGLLMMTATISASPASLDWPVNLVEQKKVLSSKIMDLKTRLPNEYGASVFADNILLALHYLKGDISNSKGFPELNGQKFRESDWGKIRDPFAVQFTLKPGETFAFHQNVLKDFQNPKITMNSKFYLDEGYKELGGLGGNGVCHLASLINWAAKTAGLETTVLVNHDFYPVPGVPREFGVAILSQDSRQNLYLKNNKNFPVTFEFQAEKSKILLTIYKIEL